MSRWAESCACLAAIYVNGLGAVVVIFFVSSDCQLGKYSDISIFNSQQLRADTVFGGVEVTAGNKPTDRSAEGL